MAWPEKPPVDDLVNLSVADVEACIWFVWQRNFDDPEAFPQPADLAGQTLKSSFPPKPWGVSGDPDGVARKFLKDIQATLEAFTLYRANIGFSAFKKAFDQDKTWGDLARTLFDNRVHLASRARARALLHLGLADEGGAA